MDLKISGCNTFKDKYESFERITIECELKLNGKKIGSIQEYTGIDKKYGEKYTKYIINFDKASHVDLNYEGRWCSASKQCFGRKELPVKVSFELRD